MDFTPSDEQRELAALAERVFADHSSPARLTEVEATDDRFDAALWRSLADAGLLGVAIPEAHGGAGFGLLELAAVLEQQGRHVAAVPAYATLVLGALPLARFGSARQQADWLPGVVAGDTLLTAALAEAPGRDPLDPSATARRTPAGWRLDGTRWSVPAAHLAARVVVPARAEDGAVGLFLVDPAQAGVERAQTTNREVHPHLHLADTPAEVLAEPSPDAAALGWLHARATVGLCTLQVGVVAEAVARTAAYVSERRQFDRPLASFQGVALRVADAFIDTEALRVTTLQAAWLLAAGRPADRAVAVAKWWAAEAGHRVGHAAQHLHGGLGADVDYPVHRYYLWAKQLEVMLGGASEQLSRLGRLLAAAHDRG